MTAGTNVPKLFWVNERNYTQCTDKPALTGIKCVRADAPELAALVNAVRDMVSNAWGVWASI